MNALVNIGSLAREQEEFAIAIVESKGANLPATIEEIIPVLAFSQARMKAYNALSDAAQKVQDQEELNRAALESGQRWGIVHLYGQKRLGEITRDMPVGKGRSIPACGSKQAVLATEGLGTQNVSDAERIAAHPEILNRVIEEAKESGDIPTKGQVLREIKAEKTREAAEQYKQEVTEKKEKIEATPAEVQKYLSDLRMVLHYLPAKAPKEGWNDESFKQAQGMVDIIRSRLEAWE
jgi:hypothetical protein